MKRTRTILVIATMFLIFYNVYVTNGSSIMSDVVMENVEALADFEWVNGKGWTCYRYVSDDVSQEVFSIVIYCGDCSTYSATTIKDPDYCTYSGMYN